MNSMISLNLNLNLKVVSVYALVLGVLYAVIGMLEVLLVLFDGWVETANATAITIPADVFGGVALIVIGTVYLFGVGSLWNKQQDGMSFALVGGMLSAVFGVLYLTTMGAGVVMYMLGEAEEFQIFAALRPAVWLFVVSLPLAYYMKRGNIYGT